MKKNCVAIVLLNWNGWKDTLECIKSLRKIRYENAKIIVVDNGSTDVSVEMIKQHAPDVLLLQSPENLGFGGGCNIGIRHALKQNNDFVWLLNNDTVVDPYALNHMIETYFEYDDIGIVGSITYDFIEKDKVYIKTDKVQRWGGGRVNYFLGKTSANTRESDIANIGFVTGCSSLIHKDIFDRVGLLDEDIFLYWDDVDFSKRVMNANYQLKVSLHSKVYHKLSASSGKFSETSMYHNSRSSVIFFYKHSKFPLIPVIIGFAGRLSRLAGKRQWRMMKVVAKGFASGWKAKAHI